MWALNGIVDLPLADRRQVCLIFSVDRHQILMASGLSRPQDLCFLQLRYVLIFDHQLKILGELLKVVGLVLS